MDIHARIRGAISTFQAGMNSLDPYLIEHEGHGGAAEESGDVDGSLIYRARSRTLRLTHRRKHRYTASSPVVVTVDVWSNANGWINVAGHTVACQESESSDDSDQRIVDVATDLFNLGVVFADLQARR